MNHRSLSCLSPIKIFSTITKLKSVGGGAIGHYHLAGSVNATYNYEFAGLYDGSYGLQYSDESTADINVTKVNEAWEQLCRLNSTLNNFGSPEVTELVRFLW
ncbi:hypothetical protein BC941DRAFT_476263 [Chlamydoabsidia padenii]|nr:hypothetical protein BC941DRAFT_476263 [Chlamydoabsidia padenii]